MLIKKHILIILFLSLTSVKTYAQNLVPNPGFELSNSCSETFVNSSIENIPDWFNELGSTVDWYSTCFCVSPGSIYCPPNLFLGNSYAFSGESMVGLCPYSEVTQNRETMGVKLLEPMQKDSAYCYGFWVKNSKNHSISYTMRNFNVAFISDTINTNTFSDIDEFQELVNEDNGDWHHLSNYYVAKGGEQFMLIGVFDPNPNYYLEVPQTTGKYMYYFFDDVSVNQCNKDSLLSVYLDLPNVLTLNNDNINEQYLIRKNNITKLNIQILNRWGNVVREYDGINETWNGTDNQGNVLSAGVYFVKAIAETTFGDVLQKTQFVEVIRL